MTAAHPPGSRLHPETRPEGIPQFVFQIGCLTFGVFMLAQIGAWFVKTSPGIVSPVWPASGFALAAALIYGLDRTVPAIYLGTLASNYLSGDPFLSVYIGPVGNVMEAVVGCLLIIRWAKIDDTLPGLRDFSRFIIAGCVAGPALFAAFNAVLLSLNGRMATSQLGIGFFDTWQTHAFGTLVFGTFFLFAMRRQDFRPISTPGRLSLLGFSVLLWAILALLLGHGLRDSPLSLLLLGLALLLALLVSLLFGLRTATLFQAMFIFLVPACVVMFQAKTDRVFAMLRSHEGQSLLNGLAFFTSLGCLLLAAFRDELAALNIKIGLALESADLCVWEWSPAGWCCRARAWKDKFGMPADRIISNARVRGLIHPDDLEGFESSFASLAASPESRWSHTYRMRDLNGRWIWVQSHAQSVRHTADDTLALVAGITRDITEERDALQSHIDAIEADAELRTLRSQLNPHFLFNALNSVRALIGRQDDRARAMITSLGNLLRELLINRDGKLQTVARELQMVRDYLEVEAIRFGARLRYSIRCEEGVASQRLPGMLVLTLVENAVKHGVSQLENGGLIEIVISHDIAGDALAITVTNDGDLTSESTGFGLTNSRRRIALESEGRGTLDLRQIPGPRVEARATLPWDERRLDS